MRKILITIGILCFGLLLISCLSNKKSRNIFCVQKFELRATTVLNPDKAFIKILTDKRLKKVLLSKEWDSINFSGGIFDTLNFNHRLIGVAETDSPNELVIGIATAKFFSCTQDQKDSIASITFEKVEINIFSKDGAWELKPCSKSETLF
jgi:hypothetical protein